MVFMSQPLGLLLVFLKLSNLEVAGTVTSDESTTHNDYNSENEITTITGTTDTSEGRETSTENNTKTGNVFQTDTNIISKVSSTERIQQNETNLCQPMPPSSSRECYVIGEACPVLSFDLQVHWNVTCDETCRTFMECCKNPKEPPGEPIKNTTCVRTYQNENVLMVSSCPSVDGNEKIKEYCENFKPDLSHDLWLMTPMTDFETNTTYKNVFCAACNKGSLNNFHFWQLQFSCFENKTAKPFKIESGEQDGRVITRLHPRKKGFWKYTPKNSHIHVFCFLHPVIAAKYSELLSCCESKRLCGRKKRQSDTFTKEICTRNVPKNPIPEIKMVGSSIILKLNDKTERIPRFTKCDDKTLRLPHYLYDLLCAHEAKCKLNLVDCPKSEYFPVESDLYDSKFADHERMINDTYLSFCKNNSWVDVNLKISFYLLRATIIGLVIQLLVFLWLPAKSTLDKDLAVFGFTLLTQCLCAAYNRQSEKLSCRLVASVWHYSMLSCFTWVVIFSYDCLLSLRQLFRMHKLVFEYDMRQFLIYLGVSQVVPLLVTIAAFIFGSSPADLYCQPVLGLDKYECLLSEVPGFTSFFIIPAFSLFVLNIYFLVRVGCLVFPRQDIKEVRQKFKTRSGFATMLSPTWMIGSLLMLTHYELPVSDVLICMVHILQAAFFLVFAFNQWLDRIMQKYEEIENDLFGDTMYFQTNTSSVTLTKDCQLLGVIRHRSEQHENENLYS